MLGKTHLAVGVGAALTIAQPTTLAGCFTAIIGGAVGGVLNLFEEAFPHRPRVYGGLMAEQCAAPLKEFIAGMREV